jgi:hypothetical protein
MLIALVLVCSLVATPDLDDCSRENAASVLRVPEEFASPATCLMRGEAYLAGARSRPRGRRARQGDLCPRAAQILAGGEEPPPARAGRAGLKEKNRMSEKHEYGHNAGRGPRGRTR